MSRSFSMSFAALSFLLSAVQLSKATQREVVQSLPEPPLDIVVPYDLDTGNVVAPPEFHLDPLPEYYTSKPEKKSIMSRAMQQEIVESLPEPPVDILVPYDIDTGSVVAPPELLLDPLPEYYTAKPEKKIISKFWDALQKRRMAALVHCEKKLWEKSTPVVEVQSVAAVDSPATARRLAPPAPPSPPGNAAPAPPSPDVPIAEYTIPVYEGRAFVKDIEASLDTCYREMRALDEHHDPTKERRDDLIRELGLVMDQIEACQVAGGEAPAADGTLAALERVKKLNSQTTDQSEVITALESSVVKLLMNKRACFDSLDLSGNLHIYLEYADLPDTQM